MHLPFPGLSLPPRDSVRHRAKWFPLAGRRHRQLCSGSNHLHADDAFAECGRRGRFRSTHPVARRSDYLDAAKQAD